MEAALSIAALLLLSYLAGSLPTSIIVGRITRGIDLREHGSGNAGGTNAFRVLGPGAGVVVILFDIGKAVVATLLIARLPDLIGAPVIMSDEGYALLAGSAAVIGHVFTIFAGFRGGKGVGAAAGMVLALYPLPFLVTLLVFAVGVMATGAVSVGSLSIAIFFPALIWSLDATGIATYSPLLKAVSIAVGLLIVFTHRSNIRRLVRGEEHRFPRLMLLASRASRRDAEERRRGDEPTENATGTGDQ